MNEHEIKKFIKTLKKYNSNNYTYEDLLDLEDYGLKFLNHIQKILSNWNDI